MAGSCLFYCRLRCCRSGDGFILASLYAEVVSDGREGGVMGSLWIS